MPQRNYRPLRLPWALASLGLGALLLWSGGWPAPVAAEVSRCERDDGTTAYTDRRCGEIGAVERAAPRGPLGSGRFYRGGCARNVQDLVFEMSTAIDARDANRLASVYHWAGMSSRAAAPVMTRLDALVQRPLVDILPVMPITRVDPRDVGLRVETSAEMVAGADPGFAAVSVAAPGGPAAPDAGYQYPSTIPTEDAEPVALRVVQTLENGSTPSETVFGLQRHFGCLWIKGG